MKKILKWFAMIVGGCLLLGILNMMIQEGYARWKMREIDKEFEANPAWVWAEPIADEENGWPLWVEAAALLKADRLSLDEELLCPMPSTPEGRRAVLEKYGSVRELLVRSFDRPRMRAPDILVGFTDYSLSDFQPFLKLFEAEAMYCAEDGDVEGLLRAYDYYLQTFLRISDGGNKWATEWAPLLFSTVFSILQNASDSPGMSADDVEVLLKRVPAWEIVENDYRGILLNWCEKFRWLTQDFERIHLANKGYELEWREAVFIKLMGSEAEFGRAICGLLSEVSNCSLEVLAAKYTRPDAPPWGSLLLAPRRELARYTIAMMGFFNFDKVRAIRGVKDFTLAHLGAQVYQRRHGVYPKSLDELVAEGILPVCPANLSEEDVNWILRRGECEDLTETSWTKRTEPREPEAVLRRQRGASS